MKVCTHRFYGSYITYIQLFESYPRLGLVTSGESIVSAIVYLFFRGWFFFF